MSREHLTDEEREAMEILDMAREGVDVPLKLVRWALAITGDLPLVRSKWA